MVSSTVRVHTQTGRDRDRDRGIPHSTRNSSSSSPPPRNLPLGFRNTSSPSPSSLTSRNPLSVPRNSFSQRRNNSPVPLSPLQNTINRDHQYTIVQQIQCLTLIIEEFLETNIEVKIEISHLIQSYIKKRTYVREFRSEQDSRILKHYVQDKKCFNKLKKIFLKIEQHLINNV